MDKDIWIVGSVCLVASFLWGRIWTLLTDNQTREKVAPPDIQVGAPISPPQNPLPQEKHGFQLPGTGLG